VNMAIDEEVSVCSHLEDKKTEHSVRTFLRRLKEREFVVMIEMKLD